MPDPQLIAARQARRAFGVVEVLTPDIQAEYRVVATLPGWKAMLARGNGQHRIVA
ncbi:hypothetical protein [Novosphingobium sp. KA1]|uniref:hypothetical protein n=1 Tax=Novosphingobium sp. (strain KA1) TaxID=164608 RepID=UPI001A8ECE6A|nr:hypothetical protein [Novosphingobium sp. KA1]